MKGIQQSYGFSSDFTTEFPDYFPQSYGTQHQSAVPMELHNRSTATENGSQRQDFWPDNSSNTIISRIGSQASAFYATEHYMGLSQFGYQDNNSNRCSQQFKSCTQKIPSYQQSGNGFFGYSPIRNEPEFQSNNGLLSATRTQTSNDFYIRPEGLYKNPFSNLYESEQLLHLKNKLLGDLDDSNRRSPSVPFDTNQDLGVSKNLYASHFSHLKQFGSSKNSVSGAVSPSKTRIRWTQDLHDRFVECVNRLGGPDKATPKAILKLMDAEGLTIFHVKSHLQKYRNAKYVPESVEGKSEKKTSTSNAAQIDIKNGTQLREALQLQLDVQRRLHEQLETQRNLQMRIEEQGKQLKMMFDQQRKTTQNLIRSRDPKNKCPTSISTTHEDPEILVFDSCDDDMIYPSKIT